MSDDFQIPRSYYEPKEELMYFWSCQDCDWEGTEPKYNDFDLKHFDECPKCNSHHIMIESDYFQK